MKNIGRCGIIGSNCLRSVSSGLLIESAAFRSDYNGECAEDLEDFLNIPTLKEKPVSVTTTDISQFGLKTFLQKLTVKPKEAKMWLKYFQTNPSESGLPFAVIYISEDVMFNDKMMNIMAWSLSFLVQNNMSPVVLLEVTNKPRRSSNFLTGNENRSQKLRKMAQYLQQKILHFGSETDLLLDDINPFQFYYKDNKSPCDLPSMDNLSLNSSRVYLSIQNRRIPIVSNIINICRQNNFIDHNNCDFSMPAIDILELLLTRFKPMKTMILGTSRGILDSENKVISDIAIPTDLSILESADWASPSQKYLIKKCASLTYLLPSHSSIILTSADTVIQELFTHHGTGTMIRFLEKILRYRTPKQLDQKQFKKLLQLSFGKSISDQYWEENEQYIDTIFVSEKFSAAAVVLRLPGINEPYLDKIAVHPQYQGTGLAASLWNEIVKSYPILFWRSKIGNKSAGLWYNAVSQGSWKTDKWTVYWYGLASCEAVLPLVNFALSHPESFSGKVSPRQVTRNSNPNTDHWDHVTGVQVNL